MRRVCRRIREDRAPRADDIRPYIRVIGYSVTLASFLLMCLWTMLMPATTKMRD